MTKKITLLLLFLIFTSVTSVSADTLSTPSANDITEEQAVRLAIDQAMTTLNTQESEIESKNRNAYFVTSEREGKNVWIVSFFEDITCDRLVSITLDGATGNVLDISEGPWWEEADRIAIVKGNRDFWPADYRATFDLLYKSKNDKSGKAIMPTDAYLSQNKALELAKQALYRELGVVDVETNDMLITYTLFSGVSNPEEATPENTMWMLTFYSQKAGQGAIVEKYQVNLSAFDGEIIVLVDVTNSRN